MFWVLARIYIKEMLFVGICAFLRTLSAAAAPLLIYAFVNYSNRDMEKTHEGLILVGWLVGCCQGC